MRHKTKPAEGLRNIECPNCNRLLFRVRLSPGLYVEIRCKCKQDVVVTETDRIAVSERDRPFCYPHEVKKHGKAESIPEARHPPD